MQDPHVCEEEPLNIVKEEIVTSWLRQADLHYLVVDVEGSSSEGYVVLGVKDVIMKSINELPKNHIGSRFSLPN